MTHGPFQQPSNFQLSVCFLTHPQYCPVTQKNLSHKLSFCNLPFVLIEVFERCIMEVLFLFIFLTCGLTEVALFIWDSFKSHPLFVA